MEIMEIVLSFSASVEELVLSENIVKEFEILGSEFSSDDIYAKCFAVFYESFSLRNSGHAPESITYTFTFPGTISFSE